MRSVLNDPATAPWSGAERALFGFLRKVNARSSEIEQGDIDALKAAGWSEEAIYDAATVCALFNFYNRWCDAAGVHAMSKQDHRASGERLARRGYRMSAGT